MNIDRVLHAPLAVWRRLPALSGEHGVLQRISEFIDPMPLWSLDAALHCGHAGLLARMLAHPPSDFPDQQFFDAMCDARVTRAARDGNLNTVVGFLTYFPNLVLTEAAAAAASNGHLHVLEKLYKDGGLVCWGIAVFRAAHPRLSVMRWLEVRFPVPVDAALLMVAIEGATLQKDEDLVVRWLWLVATLNNWPQHVLEEALSAAPLQLARWMWNTRLTPITLSLVFAASRGDLAFLTWGYTEGGIITAEVIDAAARNGHINVLEWLHTRSTARASQTAMDDAAAAGRVDILEWCRVHDGHGCSEHAFIVAAHNGHLTVIKWLLRYHRDKFHPSTIAHAAGANKLDVVRFLSSCFLPTTDAIDWAAASGNITVLQWLHENTVARCTTDAMDLAATNGHLTTVKWLHENRLEGCTVKAMDGAAAGGHLEVLVWLHQNRQEGATTAAIDQAARGGHSATVVWLSAHRRDGCTTAAMDGAIASGNLQLVKWLHAHRSEGCTYRGMDSAVNSGDIRMLQFLRNNRLEGCSRISLVWAVAHGHLHLARWLVAHYPLDWSLVDIAGAIARFGWSPRVIAIAFDGTVTPP